MKPTKRATPPAPAAPAKPEAAPPLSEADLADLEARLDALPKGMEPLDIGMLDGFLAGVLLQPKAVPRHLWQPYVLDSEGRPAPAGFESRPIQELVLRRYQELNRAITERQWFDPWVFELDEADSPSEAVLPWVAGFSLACEVFPDLMRQDAADLLEPLASLFMHFDPEDLEDADELLEAIDELEPPEDMNEAVESLVRSTLLLADITRPQKEQTAAAPKRKPPPRSPRRSY